MTKWARATHTVLCGGPHDQPHMIEVGSPVFVIELAGVKRVRYRCQQCAGEAPPDLPLLAERGSRTKKMQPLRGVMNATFKDWKSLQALA